MGALPAAHLSIRGEKKERRRARQERASIRQQEIDEEAKKKAKIQETGRSQLIATTPQGVLNPQNSGRKRLSA